MAEVKSETRYCLECWARLETYMKYEDDKTLPWFFCREECSDRGQSRLELEGQYAVCMLMRKVDGEVPYRCLVCGDEIGDPSATQLLACVCDRCMGQGKDICTDCKGQLDLNGYDKCEACLTKETKELVEEKLWCNGCKQWHDTLADEYRELCGLCVAEAKKSSLGFPCLVVSADKPFGRCESRLLDAKRDKPFVAEIASTSMTRVFE